MSGWSPSRITILAARRVPPPDLMEPAPESAQRMKLTGPEAWPPFERASPSPRRRERLTPAPEPPRKISDSEAIQRWIEGIVSLTDRMKQADAWLTWGSPGSVGGSSTSRMRSSSCSRVAASTPQLNQTGELKAAFWVTRMWRSSCEKVSASSSSSEVAALHAVVADGVDHAVDHLAQAALAAWIVHAVAEVLGRDDAHGRVRPVERELAAGLLEDHPLGRAVLARLRDARVARPPGHLVIGVDIGAREAPGDPERPVGHGRGRVNRHRLPPGRWCARQTPRAHRAMPSG